MTSKKLETIERNEYANLYNPTLAVTIDLFTAVDQSCQDILIIYQRIQKKIIL
jgi:hypothetical protein